MSRKRARAYLHSPDPAYLEKLQEVVRVLELARQSDGKIVVLFADELTFYRQPTLAQAYCQAKSDRQPRARFSYQRNTSARVAGAVNALSGRVTYRLASKCGLKTLLKFYEQLCQSYPEAEVIYLIEDNWSVHFHPDILEALAEQQTPFELKVSRYWEKVKGKAWSGEKLPLQIVPLPTYASWTNPIEKLWRWLKQEVIHLHRQADDWQGLKAAIEKFLEGFGNASAEVLRYMGLTENSKLYAAALALLKEQPG